MTLSPQDKKTLSAMRMEKAYKYLQDAAANYEEKRYETSVNRSYYAVLNAVRSILILEGINPESHKGVITMLSLRFVKPGLIPKDTLRKFELLLSRRTDADYGDLETIDKNDAEDSMRTAEKIVKLIDKVRKKMNV
jgi:uncharacterized protein (UPF0332 family)